MKYFICNCFYESKLAYCIFDIKKLIPKGFINSNCLTFVKNDCCYICCKETITFLFQCYRNSDFFCTCATTDEPISCIGMVKFDYEDICQICEKTLFFYFSSILNLVYNEPA